MRFCLDSVLLVRESAGFENVLLENGKGNAYSNKLVHKSDGECYLNPLSKKNPVYGNARITYICSSKNITVVRKPYILKVIWKLPLDFEFEC